MTEGVLPNFLIVGAQKAGTTWLASVLSQHPDVFVAPHEIHFFDKQDAYHRGLSWYASQFSDAAGKRAVGEKTPDYLWTTTDGAEGHIAGSHVRISAALPDARLIVILRNPVDRAVSAVNHILRSGRVSPRVDLDDLLIGDAHGLLDGHGVLEQGRYAEMLEPYFDVYPRSQIEVLVFEEDVIRDAAQCMRRVCRHIGVADFAFDPSAGVRNESRRTRSELFFQYYTGRALPRPLRRVLRQTASSWKPRPSAESLRVLEQQYVDANEQLYVLLGRRIPDWDASTKRRLAAVSSQ